MKRIARVQILLPVAALAIASCAAWALQTDMKLTMDGSVLSTNVRIVNGRPYVPLTDVARALDRVIVKKGGAYSLNQAASVDKRDGLNGKLATDIFSGSWRLNVASIQDAATYTPLFGSDKTPVTPQEVGDVLAIVRCQLKNGTKQMQDVDFDASSSGNTALMDSQNHGYVPVAYDARDSGGRSAKMPPGSTLDFVIIFSVPKSADLTHLTYSVGGGEMDRFTDFQVSLGSQLTSQR